MLKKVILDLDQTIISAEEYSLFANGGKKKYKSKRSKKEFTEKVMDKSYIVYARPGLEDFLDFLFANFSVSVWTAASKSYAMFIIDNFILTKPERKLEYVFFAHHCELSYDMTETTKNLSLLWDKYEIPGFNKDNTIIIDDYDEVKDTQPENCINIKPFYFIDKDSVNDTELLKIQRLLSRKECARDVSAAY